MKNLIFALLFCSLALPARATIHRVNSTPGTHASFASLTAAVGAAAAGDTIHLEGAPTSYGNITLNKRLVITGPGYFLNEASPNPFTQAVPLSAMVEVITCNAGSKGSVIEGVQVNSYCHLNDSLITVQRNFIDGNIYLAYSRNTWADTIRNNFISGSISVNNASYKARDILLYNNILSGASPISVQQGGLSNVSGFCINNSFVSPGGSPAGIACANFIFQNNIFAHISFGLHLSANSFFNNIAANTGIPAGNGNLRNVSMAAVYQGWTVGTGHSSDGRYLLAPGSPATGAGLLNNTAVDCGAFGGPAPYVLSGMPAIPSIYILNVPAQVNTGVGTIHITLEAASH